MPRNIALLIPDFYGGGAERVALNLATGLKNIGCDVTLLVLKKRGSFKEEVPEDIGIVELQRSRMLTSIFALAEVVESKEFDAIISFKNYVNICLLAASLISGRKTPVIVTEHNHLSTKKPSEGKFIRKNLFHLFSRTLIRFLYPYADHIVGVSKGVANDLQKTAKFRRDVDVVYNPVVSRKLLEHQPSSDNLYPWFSNSEPVIIGVGRLTEQKNFSLLIKAFRHVNERVPSRLIIFGEGDQRELLEALVKKLNLDDRVSLPGFSDEIFASMSAADLFVLSSKWEGLPTVLIEAMACGTPVVSVDCPSGPDEILESGKWGRIVPMDDAEALANAMVETLNAENFPDVKSRAADFGFNVAAENYLRLLSGKSLMDKIR